jgi:PTH1 family peptidyl-tRNA hydrolase
VSTPPFQLIVGLGNPGRDYVDTRHNVGFMIVDRLVAQAGAEWRTEKRRHAAVARAGATWLCKPQTFMNLSGEAVASLAGFHKIPASAVLVILDDLALPLGKLRVRADGSAGGHNGLQSVLDHLGTNAVARLRIGIGSAQPGEAVGHVLGRFRDDEKTALTDALDRALAAVESAQMNGLPAAMNAFN